MEAALQKEREAHARRMAQENQQQQQRKKKLLMSGGGGGGAGLRRKGGAGGGSMAAVFATVEEDQGDEDGKEQQQQQQQEQQRKRSRWDTQKGGGQKKDDIGDEEGKEEGPLSEAVQATIRQAAEWIITNPQREKELLVQSKGKKGWEFLFEDEEEGEAGEGLGRRKRARREREFFLEVLEEGRVKEQVKRVALGLDEVGGGGGGGGGGGEGGGGGQMAAAAAAASVAALSRMNLPASTVPRLSFSSAATAAAAATATAAAGPPPTSAAASASASPTSTQQRKPKRNRWGPSPGETSTPSLPPVLPPSLLAIAAAANDEDTPKEKGKKGKGGKQSLDVFLPSVMDAAAMAQLKEQKRIQLIEKKIREAARLKSLGKEGGREGGGEMELFEERMLHYEGLAEKEASAAAEVAEEEEGEGGGTWEHKKRAREMLKTAQDALNLTLASRGKHHLSQFLPSPGDLDGYLSKKGEGGGEDYEGNKLDVGNSTGMQMLQKQGWKEGQGLGKEGRKGVVAPVNMKGTEGEGLGVGGEEEEEEKGDDFDEYRKRMMLAYRFRPNPLNNPRREYY